MRRFLVLLLFCCYLEAQDRQPLRGSSHWAAKVGMDMGAVPDSQPLEALMIHLAIADDKRQDLERLVAAQQDPASPLYRQWLTPEEFRTRFAPGDAAMAQVEEWLSSNGLKVTRRARGGLWLLAEGTAGQAARAFGTRLRRYRLEGAIHFANAGEVSLPASIAPLIGHVDGLSDILPEARHRSRPVPATTNSAGLNYLAPDDLAIIYNIRPLLAAGIDGTGQKVAIVGQSLIDVSDYQAWRRRYNLPANDPQQVLVPNGGRPTISDDTVEANLDLQWVSAVARRATIYYVYSRSVTISIAYVIDQNLAPVMSVSYGFGCEARAASAITSTRVTVLQAIAQGITWVNASGDAGPAGCDPVGTAVAQNGLATDFPGSIPELTAVGGTQFNEGSGTYWRATNDANLASVLSYIPEIPWNESANGVVGGGGGVSTLFPRPSWQDGFGDSLANRMVPDVSFTAAAHDGYYVLSGGRGLLLSGTSASTPVFAGVLTLLNQYLTGRNQSPTARLGNINPRLYRLARTNPEVYHDTVDGNSLTPCANGSPDCVGGVLGYPARPGYDLTTGLGSLDVDRFVRAFDAGANADSQVTLSLTPNPIYKSQTANTWSYTLRVAEQAGVATTLTDFLIDGVSFKSRLVSFFGRPDLAALGTLSAPLVESGLTFPITRSFELRGVDASGRTWSRSAQAQFLGAAPVPQIAAIANGASFRTTFAPGMLISAFGTNLAPYAQAAAAVPLLNFMGGVSATVNGVNAPLYYISPGQLNLQIPYETQSGNARLTVTNGTQSATFNFTVADTAPGVFVDAKGATVPYASGSAGQTLILFVTGAGLHSPNVATGAAPSASTAVSQLPRPTQNVRLTIGNQNASVVFAGIPPGLVGVTQINFTVPAGLAAGVQPLVVNIGGVDSAPANFTILR